VYLEDDPDSGRTAVVIVPDDQLSLAIGREGQNARLAAKLTGWRIDIKSVSEAVQDALDNLTGPALQPLAAPYADMINEVRYVMEKKASNRAVMPEEFNQLGKFADIVQKRLLQLREEARQKRLAEINAVRSTLPQAAFRMGVEELDLPETITEALMPLGNVGEIMLRFLIDERRLRSLLADCPPESLARVQDALDQLVLPELIEEPADELSADLEAATDESAQPLSAEAMIEQPVAEALVDADSRVGLPGSALPTPEVAVGEEVFFEDEEDLLARKEGDLDKGDKRVGTNKKKERTQRRQIVYDEDLGEMIVKRRRKGSRSREQWDEWDE
jgi:N utilization substance protein A